MTQKAILLALAAIVTVAIVVLAVFEGTGEDPPRDDPPTDGSGSADAGPEGLAERIRDRLGRDAAAIVSLGDTRPAEGAAQVAWLRAHRPELDLAIRSGDPDAGGAALHVLGKALESGVADVRTLIASPGYRAVWLRALTAKDPKLRAAGVDFLARLGDDKSRTRIVRMLEDPSPTVRAVAVHSYGGLAEPGGGKRLAALADGEPDFRVRLAVLDAFRKNAKLRGVDARRIEAKAVAEGSDAERIQAMANVAHFRDQDALEAIAKNLDHEHANVRKAALNALRLLKDPRALPALKAYVLKEREDDLRTLAAKIVRELSG